MTHTFSPRLDAFGGIEMHYAELNDFENNCYIIVDVATGDTLIVDAAANAPAIVELVNLAVRRAHNTGAAKPHVTGVLTTHRHHDHWQALAEIKAHYGAPSYAGADDAAEIPGTTDHPLRHHDTLPLGATSIAVIGLRGHTPGSVALALTVPEHPVRLITGDSLFPGGPGKTGSPADFTQLMNDLEARVFAVYDDATVVYPGHGKATTLGAERQHLGEWRERGW